MTYLIVIISLSMTISFLCSIMEACLLSMSNVDIAEVAEKRPRFGKIWNTFKGNIQKPIAVILIVNTISHTAGASLSGAQFDELFGPEWIILFSLIFSFAMIQWTEILPKTLGVKYRKRIAIASALPMAFMIKIFTPVIRFIELLNKPFISKSPEAGSVDAVQEISVLSRFAFVNNLISSDQEQIISRTVGLAKKKVEDVMIPSGEIKFLHDGMNMTDALVEAHLYNHTRYPLVRNQSPQEVIGYINFKDIFGALQINPEDPSLNGIKRTILSFREHESFHNVFKKMLHGHQHIAVVLNANNELIGLVTLEDIIEEIIGEIEDEYDELPNHLYQIAASRFICGGGVNLQLAASKFALSIDTQDITINNWIKQTFGGNQKPGNKYELENFFVSIKKISRSKIQEVVIEKK